MFIYQKHIRKSVVTLCITLLLVTQTVVLFYPQPTKAVGAPDVVAALSGKWSADAIVDGLLSASLGALVNGFSYFMRKLAYDTATYVASGGKGQGALAFQQGAGSYFKTVALDSVASTVEQFGSPFGLNLCKPPDLKFQVFLQVGIRKLYADPGQGGPAPKCSWSDFQKNWDGYADKFGDRAIDAASNAFSSALKVNQSDFGVALDLLGKVDRLNAEAVAGAETSRLEGKGFKAVTGLISGDIKTPAAVIEEETKALTGGKQTDLTSQQIAGIYGAGMWQVIPAAAGVFVNTLTSQLLQKVLTDGLFPDASGGGGGGGSAIEGITSGFSSAPNQNRQLAETAFNFLFTAVPAQELSIYPLMEEFNNCPDNPGLNNCVADAGLVKGVKQAATGRPLTIREAMQSKEGVLHPDWPLIPPTREVDNVIDKKSGTRCFQQKYCYSNLQKLRRSRILPLGFEIAALKADPDKPEDWTLEKVVKGFEDCNPATGAADAKHPYCHLIDPNWVIRLPEPRCESKVYGPNLVSDNNPTRRQECADVATCIAEDAQGHCLGNYGYCLREKNTWRLTGSACPAHFNTCKTYTNSKDATSVSYLSRTLDFGQCNQQSVGCRAYSLEVKPDGVWRSSAESIDVAKETLTGRSHTIYFNDAIKNYSCPLSAEGCSAVYRANDDGTKGETLYLKKALGPLFNACYLVDDAIQPSKKVWPSSVTDLQTIAKRPNAAACNPLSTTSTLAVACLENEVGCEAYIPADGGDIVTGIVGANECPSSCVGYETFKQEQPMNKGAFEPTAFPLYFIPGQATQCSPSYDGCSEFTNIDTAQAGGETLEYYSDLQYCEKPNGTNEKTYYSWEGTISQGYVLRLHKLLPISPDPAVRYSSVFITALKFTPEVTAAEETAIKTAFSAGPAYVEDSKTALIDNYFSCNETTYQAALQNPYGSNVADADCRALYDDKGVVYYRLLTKTLSVSPSCHPLRKTEGFLYDEPALNGNKPLCDAKGGDWNVANNTCRLCYNGGIYNNGSCIYWTTSQSNDDKSCPREAAGCRSYTGKAALNLYPILESKFEPSPDATSTALLDAKLNWSTGTIKPESLTVGQYSLQVNDTNLDYAFTSNTLEKNKFYQLEFWARGNPQNLDIALVNKIDNAVIGNPFTFDLITKTGVKAPIGQTWQQYTLGPIEFTGDGAQSILLRFTRSMVPPGAPAAPYYLDNVRLTRINSKQTLIKNSWKRPIAIGEQVVQADAPIECDANPTDGLPGAALSCRAYTDSFTNPMNTTGFDQLCRPEAVGCSALFDSQNTLSTESALGYNLWCVGNSGTECTLTIATEEIGKCTVPVGEAGCYVPKTTLSESVIEFLRQHTDSTALVASTIIIPADTPTTTPLYLTYQKKFTCDAGQVGCQKVALEEQVLPTSNSSGSFQFSEYTYRNNPDLYDQILCGEKQVGCSQFKSDTTITFFKDPKATGGKLCVYKDQVELGGVKVSGWFKEDVGRCDHQKDILCKQDSDCGAEHKCTDIGAVACYPDYQTAGGDYGIWSNKSPGYTGAIGVCPSEYNQCTELLDRADTSNKDEPGKSYFVIFNNALRNSAKDCNGQASLKDGCVLFDQTENPNKLYDASATYEAATSTNPKYGPVDLKSAKNSAENDSNVLLKVQHNRECSEWLSCKNMVSVQDGKEERKICYEYKSCRKLNGILECSDWSNSSDFVFSPLTEDVYTSRDSSWYGEDYSGYSLFGQFPISNLTYVSIDKDPIHYAAYHMSEFVYGADADSLGCKNNGKPNWAMCGFGNGGRCYQQKCIYPLDGMFPKEAVTDKQIVSLLDGASCKTYPEADSPFSRAVAASGESNATALKPVNKSKQEAELLSRFEFKNKSPGYEGANVCQDGECSCYYKKVTYKTPGRIDYWDGNRQDIPAKVPGVCVGGTKDGSVCVADLDCSSSEGGTVVSSGICSPVKNTEIRQGLLGTCLEYDLSRPIDVAGKKQFPCLTWLPLNTAASGIDPYGNKQNAGYSPALDAVTVDPVTNQETIAGSVFCRNATGNSLGAYDKKYFTKIISDSTITTPQGFVFSLCSSNDSTFECNKKIYRILFNKYGDYIFDATKMMGIVTTKTSINGTETNQLNAYEVGVNPLVVYDAPIRTFISFMNDPFNALWNCPDGTPGVNDGTYLSGSNGTTITSQCTSGTGFPRAYGGDPLIGGLANKNTINWTTAGQGLNDYVNRMYSLMQMWAWHGGMYGRGEAVEKKKAAPFTIDAPVLEDCEKKFPVGDGSSQQDKLNITFLADCKINNINKQKSIALALQDQINKAAPDPDLEVVDGIQYPNAVLLFTSSLYFRDYLFTSLRHADKYQQFVTPKENADKIQVYLEKRPLHDGNYSDLVVNNSLYQEPGSWVSKLYPHLIPKIDSANQPIFNSNNRTNKSAMKGYDPVFANYESKYKLYEQEISKLHYGPLMTPPAMKTVEDMMASVITIDFDYLRNQQPTEQKTSPQGINYELQSWSDPTHHGLYAFRIRPLSGQYKNQIRYAGYAVSPEISSDVDLLSVFKEDLDNLAGDNQSNSAAQNFKWQTEGQTSRSMVSVYVRFTESGQMQQNYKNDYMARYRDGDKNEIYDNEFLNHDGRTPYLSVVTELKPRCAEYGIVYNNNPSLGERTDKAWTDRLWGYGTFDLGLADVTGSGNLKHDTPLKPFGSTNLSSGSFEGSQKACPECDGTISWFDARRRYVFDSSAFDGIMYNCDAPVLEATTDNTDFINKNNSASLGEGRMGVQEVGTWPFVKGGNYFGCWGKPGKDIYNLIAPQAVFPSPTGKDYLSDYFAAYYKIIKNKEQNTLWDVSNIWDPGKDRSGDSLLSNQGIPPQIYSLDPTTCYILGTKKPNCLPGEKNNVTVNRINGTEADYNSDGVPDEDTKIITGKDSLQATLQFFGFADHNRMPINRVMIDWGDDNIMNANTIGKYQNHKPFCITDGAEANADVKECETSKQLTCKQDADCPAKSNGDPDKCTLTGQHFGNASRACYPKYFEFFHGYACNESIKKLDAVSELDYLMSFGELTTEEQAEMNTHGYTDKNAPIVCKFKPKVQILDNWGWCNGSCSAVNGCHNGAEKYCNVETYPSQPHWTEFKGTIIVVPSK